MGELQLPAVGGVDMSRAGLVAEEGAYWSGSGVGDGGAGSGADMVWLQQHFC
jgi:hypothetical protein